MVAILFLAIQLFLLTRKKPENQPSGTWLPFLLFIPFVFYIISLAYSDNFNEGYKYVERTMLLLILPWVFYFNRAYISELSLRRTIRFLTLVACLLTLYCFGRLLLADTFQKAMLVPDAYYVIRTKLERVTGLHPTYFSLFLALPLLAIQYELKKRTISLKWALPAIIVLIAGLFTASSKMILAATVLGSILIFSEGLSFKALSIRVAVLIGTLALIVFTVRPVKERLMTLVTAATESGVEQNNPDSLRKGIYRSTVDAISENIWWGTGIGDYQQTLNSKYEEFSYELAVQRGFNTHNQYLQFWLSSGLLPFALFVISVVVQFLIAISTKHRLHLAFITLMAMSFLTENILARQDGIFMYAFFSSMFCYASWARHKGRVYINGRFKIQSMTGVQRFASEMSYQLRQLSKKVIVVTPAKVNDEEQRLLFPFIKGNAWEQLVLPSYLRFCGSPLLINLGNSGPVYYSNQILTLHDVAFKARPKWFSRNFIKWYNFMIPRILKKCRHIITVSQFSKNEILKYFKVPESQVSVLYNGVPRYVNKSDDLPRTINGEYALCVGSLSERKNQKNLIEAYLRIARPKFKLVIAGSYNPHIFSEQHDLLKAIEENDNVIFSKNPTDVELASLYAHARFTVYIPFYEGFGIPVLESILYQKPILLSDIPVFRELFDDVALFYSLDNNDNLRTKLEEMYESTDFWAAKVAQYDFDGRGFSYYKSAEKLMEITESYGSNNRIAQ